MSQIKYDLRLYIDGAARGNPGPAAYGIVMSRDGQPTLEESGCLGNTTNNIAEYTALVRALELAGKLAARNLLIHSDSELMVKQMNGEYKVKNDQLKKLYEQAQRFLDNFDVVTIRHVRREYNSDADRLCNEALDGRPRPLNLEGAAVAPARAVKEEKLTLDDEVLACLRQAKVADADKLWGDVRSILEAHAVRLPK